MKKLILFFVILVLWVSPVFAGGWVFTGGAAPACDDCSGDLKLGVHFENDVDIEVGTPCGCSDGDSTLTLAGDAAFSGAQKQDGTYSLLITDSGDYAALSLGADTSLINFADFKIEFHMYVTTVSVGERFMDFKGDASNSMFLTITEDSPDLRIQALLEGGGVTDSIENPNNSGNGRSTGEWFFVQIAAKDGVAGNDFTIRTCDADGVSHCNIGEEDDDLYDAGSFDHSKLSDVIFGEDGTSTQAFYIDNIKIYGTSGY